MHGPQDVRHILLYHSQTGPEFHTRSTENAFSAVDKIIHHLLRSRSRTHGELLQCPLPITTAQCLDTGKASAVSKTIQTHNC
jgi:hypothetical protein